MILQMFIALFLLSKFDAHWLWFVVFVIVSFWNGRLLDEVERKFSDKLDNLFSEMVGRR